MKKILLLLTILLGMFFNLSAQTQQQYSGWFMFLNNTRFSKKWGMQLDAQLRMANHWEYVRNTLVRPGLTYFIDDQNNITLGYAWQTTQSRLIGSDNNLLNEHRIFEQYIYTHRLKSVFAMHRLRLEQRFIEQASANVFAQRFRYFFRLIQPLQRLKPAFSKGPFIALQNEIFLNVQNNYQLNNSLFDQNRLYASAGYRFSKKLDIDAGYLNQALHGIQNNTVNHVIQLAVYTRF